MHLNTQPAQAAPSQHSKLAPQSRWRHLASPAWMVLVAFAVRVLWIALAHTYRFRTNEANFGFGWEIGRLAYSLANGHGFSSPFGGDTGPSAWTPPLYPWILSLAFRMFGSYSHAAAFAMLVFNSVFAALTSWTVYRIARRLFSETVAVWSGWIWALYPDTIFWSVKWIWETSLSAFLLSLLFMLTVEMEGDERSSSWLGYGLLWGVAALTNPSALSFLPFAGCWLVYQLHRRGKRFRSAGCAERRRLLDDIMPWLVRNYEVFGRFVFVRDNFGNELRIGNNPLAEGLYVLAYHPSQQCHFVCEIQAAGRARVLRRAGTSGAGMDRAASRQVRGPQPAAFLFFLERHTAAIQNSVAGGNQEHAFLCLRARHLGTAAGLEAADSRRLSVCQSAGRSILWSTIFAFRSLAIGIPSIRSC